MHSLKIAIIGDFNFTFNAHHATNMALDHASEFLEVEISYYWIRIAEVAEQRPYFFEKYDAFWVAPGPFLNPFYLNGVFARLTELSKPVLVTGEAFRLFIEHIIVKFQLNKGSEKLISENLVSGTYFESSEIFPVSKSFQKNYENFSKMELTSTRYSLYPNLRMELQDKNIDIEALNQFDDIEAISLNTHEFFTIVSYYPQVSSTRDRPHPLVYNFLKSTHVFKSMPFDP